MGELIVSSSWKDRLQALAGSRRETWVVAAVVAVAVLVAVLLWSRGAPANIAPPAHYSSDAPAPVAESSSGSTLAPATPTPQSTGVVIVYVAGAVRRPGVYELAPGARVADAIQGAAGPRRGAELDALNLAELVTDGAKIYVPHRGESVAGMPSASAGSSGYPASSTPTSGAGAPATVSINSADEATLETIPGIGSVKAAAILDYRSQIGAFSSIDQLLEVTGIGPATLESIRPYITL